jgi:hypothetical protein
MKNNKVTMAYKLTNLMVKINTSYQIGDHGTPTPGVSCCHLEVGTTGNQTQISQF